MGFAAQQISADARHNASVPQSSLVVVMGDMNFKAAGDITTDLNGHKLDDADLRHAQPANVCTLQDALHDLIEISQPKATHYNARRCSESRLDRVYC
eukprot:7504911-Karenia_brevis.AAC.1